MAQAVDNGIDPTTHTANHKGIWASHNRSFACHSSSIRS
jgi:hypothetical protein